MPVKPTLRSTAAAPEAHGARGMPGPVDAFGQVLSALAPSPAGVLPEKNAESEMTDGEEAVTEDKLVQNPAPPELLLAAIEQPSGASPFRHPAITSPESSNLDSSIMTVSVGIPTRPEGSNTLPGEEPMPRQAAPAARRGSGGPAAPSPAAVMPGVGGAPFEQTAERDKAGLPHSEDSPAAPSLPTPAPPSVAASGPTAARPTDPKPTGPAPTGSAAASPAPTSTATDPAPSRPAPAAEASDQSPSTDPAAPRPEAVVLRPRAAGDRVETLRLAEPPSSASAGSDQAVPLRFPEKGEGRSASADVPPSATAPLGADGPVRRSAKAASAAPTHVFPTAATRRAASLPVPPPEQVLPLAPMPIPLFQSSSSEPAAAAPHLATAPAEAAPAELAILAQLDLAQESEWLDQLARDIVRSAGGEASQLRFRLNPETLGHLQVELSQDSGGTSVRLTAETEAARLIIADAQPKLLAEARAQGLRLTESHVDLGSGAGPGSGDPHRREEAQREPPLKTARLLQSDAGGVGKPSPDRSERYA